MPTDSYTYVAPINGVYAVPESEVRFLLGDTEPSGPDSLTDAEVSYLLAQTSDESGNHVRAAAARGARQLAVYFDRKAQVTSKSVAGLSISYAFAATAQAYKDLAAQLEQDPQGGGVTIQWSGQNWGTRHDFSHGQFDNTGFGYGQPGWDERNGPW